MFGHTGSSRNGSSRLLTGAWIAFVAASIFASLSAVAAAPVPVVGKAAIATAQSQCAIADFGSFAGVSLLTTNFTSLGPNLLKDPIVAKYMNMGNLATNPKETPTRPQLYMFHTSTDETVPYGPALKTAQTWCDEGARIEFTTRNGGTTHAQTQSLYSPQAIAWLDSTLKDSHVVVRQCAFLTKGLAV
ncbi:BQ5605_C003g02478 [Microbotryum silenes-dioicae]|uniref:triacylglycerol lipase n=1 Tax=Microbotryum silenes-dioicae TaxID=796604 RepID=A0A2X0M1N3_9BASI|nr:BQ5605_C003g02478 [Microbotryum silenes-dioicae]